MNVVMFSKTINISVSFTLFMCSVGLPDNKLVQNVVETPCSLASTDLDSEVHRFCAICNLCDKGEYFLCLVCLQTQIESLV